MIFYGNCTRCNKQVEFTCDGSVSGIMAMMSKFRYWVSEVRVCRECWERKGGE